ncbi:single-stranded DNA-binding protein [Blastococcus haudaquaticus]|uniref:Single-strand DNA-binding protein n=1 Tax=Blastococcus haudaquaticus TaxID=1938745 RepID=A0A286H3I1_9ACTN|nr:single-stranded DNA-binding protein [Blastococcus haudaquaticus]SOE02317.1 single-strand DNA-binding protein [Blastococcus haudaquaticus]
MNDTELTVVGNVVDSPRRVRLENSAVTNFRMASTARRYDSGRQEFVDAGTLWVDVEAWGELGGNVARSISKGDPVIVRGTLTTRSWESENGRRSAPQIKANAVGPNLARGWTDFHRPARSAPAGQDPGAVGAEPAEDEDPQGLVAGRDYEAGDETLNEETPTGLAMEPAHV